MRAAGGIKQHAPVARQALGGVAAGQFGLGNDAEAQAALIRAHEAGCVLAAGVHALAGLAAAAVLVLGVIQVAAPAEACLSILRLTLTCRSIAPHHPGR